MPEYTELTAATTENAVTEIAALALAGAKSHEVPADRPRAYVLPTGHRVHVETPAEYEPPLLRKIGYVDFTDAISFARYVDLHRDKGTSLWANAKAGKLTAVLDDHDEDAPGRGEHRARLTLEATDDWRQWVGCNDAKMGQARFAEHIEDGAPCIRQPSAAEMLEIAQSFKANTRVNFESGKRIANGETQLTYVETVEAKAGRKGNLEIPETIGLALAPWTSCEGTYEMTARLRYRINDGDLVLWYKLDRPDDVLRLAFADVLSGVETSTGVAAYHGSPRP